MHALLWFFFSSKLKFIHSDKLSKRALISQQNFHGRKKKKYINNSILCAGQFQSKLRKSSVLTQLPTLMENNLRCGFLFQNNLGIFTTQI